MAEDNYFSQNPPPAHTGMSRVQNTDSEEEHVKLENISVDTAPKTGRKSCTHGKLIWTIAIILLVMATVISIWLIYNGMKDDGGNGVGEAKTGEGELSNDYTKLERLCSSLLLQGKFRVAVDELKKQDIDISLPHLSKIIEGSYNNGESRNLENLMEFIQLLPNCRNKATANTALFNEMEKHDQLKSPFILVLHEGLKPCLESFLNLTSQDAKLKIHINNLVELWASQIRGGDYEDIILFVNSSNLTKSSITSYLSDIIKRCYESPSDLDQLLNFISQLPLSSQLASGYLSILNLMREKEQTTFERVLQVAHRIKQGMTAEGKTNELSVFKNLKNMFPEFVRNLIWNGICTIQTFGGMEHLYTAGDYFKLPDDSRQVYTWIAAGGYWADPKHKWVFEPADDDGKTFYIKSYFFSDSSYLCQSEETWDAERNAIQCVSGTEGQPADCKWELEAIAQGTGGGWVFAITTSNKKSGTLEEVYMYAENDSHNKDPQRRRVFTWIPGGVPENALWVLGCD